VPCNGVVDRHIDLTGFLYAMRNLLLDTNAGPFGKPNNWTVNGVVRVDGNLTLTDNTSLDVFFDDLVNHQILTRNFEVQVDTITAVP